MARREASGPAGRRASSFRAAPRRERAATRRKDRPDAQRARPESARRSRSARSLKAQAQVRPRTKTTLTSPLTRQILLLGIALVVIALSLAYPLRNYVQQQAVAREAAATQAELEQEVADLNAKITALQDPSYIRAEAKRRLQYVTPDEQVYVVQLPPELVTTAAESADNSTPAPSVAGADVADADDDDAMTDAADAAPSPWYRTLWDTLRDAGS